jgi:Flp pilus assembly protein TadG
VEFALATGVLCLLLIGGAEVGRAMWTWQAAAEAARLGARLAAVCGLQAPAIRSRMQALWPALQQDAIAVRGIAQEGSAVGAASGAAACDASDCAAVQVALEGASHRAFVPWLPGVWSLPPMTTTLRREAMDPTDNEVCQ